MSPHSNTTPTGSSTTRRGPPRRRRPRWPTSRGRRQSRTTSEPDAGGAVDGESAAHVERRVGRRRRHLGLLDEEREHLGDRGQPRDPVGQLAARAHQLEQPVAGDVAEVVRRRPSSASSARTSAGVDRRSGRAAPRRTPSAGQRRPVAVIEASQPRRRASEAPLACRPLLATITISSPGARSAGRGSAARPGGTMPTALPASSMSSVATSPGSDGDSPPPHVAPASTHASRQPGQKRLVPVPVRVPVRRSGREVGVHHERQRPDADTGR